MLRTLLAPNASAMTLDGTRTYVVGEQKIAIIDPGPDDPVHLDAIASAVADADAVILLTHQHPDHAAGAATLGRLIRAPVRSAAAGTLADSDVIATDAGALRALATPGHTPDHMALHWPAESAIFVGDLMMGGLDTALVAPPEGNLADYLASLDRLEAFAPAILYPSHGPAMTDGGAAFERYRLHRTNRLNKVRQALTAGMTDENALLTAVYGEQVPAELQDFARAALRAYVEYLGTEQGS